MDLDYIALPIISHGTSGKYTHIHVCLYTFDQSV